jgi:hypothetical protein
MAKKGAIVDAFYGIRWGHHLAGLDSPTDHPTVKMAFEGAQRICAKPVKEGSYGDGNDKAFDGRS